MTDPSQMAKLAADVFSQKVPSPKSPSGRTWEKVVEDAKKSPLRKGVKALSKAASPAIGAAAGGTAGALLGAGAASLDGLPEERLQYALGGAALGAAGGYGTARLIEKLRASGAADRALQAILDRIQEVRTAAGPAYSVDLGNGMRAVKPRTVPFDKMSSPLDVWRGLSPTVRRGAAGAAVGAPVAGAAQYLMESPLPSGRSREEIAAQSAYDRARTVNEESDSPGYVARMGEEMLLSSANMAGINREHRLKAALLAALLGGVAAGGTGALSARIGAAAR